VTHSATHLSWPRPGAGGEAIRGGEAAREGTYAAGGELAVYCSQREAIRPSVRPSVRQPASAHGPAGHCCKRYVGLAETSPSESERTAALRGDGDGSPLPLVGHSNRKAHPLACTYDHVAVTTRRVPRSRGHATSCIASYVSERGAEMEATGEGRVAHGVVLSRSAMRHAPYSVYAAHVEC